MHYLKQDCLLSCICLEVDHGCLLPKVGQINLTSQGQRLPALWRKHLANESSILQFLSERVNRNLPFKQRLLSIIEQSKSDSSIQIAAANAITILVKSGFQFNRADLRGIRISGADLSLGIFDSTLLSGADLRDVNLRRTWLRGADLKEARLDGAQFGEL